MLGGALEKKMALGLEQGGRRGGLAALGQGGEGRLFFLGVPFPRE